MRHYHLILAVTLSLPFLVKASDCANDAKKFCPGIGPGGGKLALCLSDYKDGLSSQCLKELNEYKEKTSKKNPCHEDLAKFCAEFSSQPWNIKYCLLKYEPKLSKNCSKDFSFKKGKIITKEVCALDIAQYCYKELTGFEGGVNKCLIKNISKLSPFCGKQTNNKIIEMKKRNPCFEEALKLCPQAIKFVDIQDCLYQKKKKLSVQCQKMVLRENEKINANPCYRDLITHCKPKLSPVQQNECLDLNKDHLNKACTQFRVEEKKKIKQMVKICEKDRLKYCKEAPVKGGAILKCLRKNSKKISKDCKNLL